MIYSFYCSIEYDVVKEIFFSANRCVETGPYQAFDMGDDFYTSASNLNYTLLPPMSCYNVHVVEYSPEFQRYYDTESRSRADSRYGLNDIDAVESGVMWVFLFCQVFSFCVLIIYIISSMVNPVVMLTIGYQEVIKCILIFVLSMTVYH